MNQIQKIITVIFILLLAIGCAQDESKNSKDTKTPPQVDSPEVDSSLVIDSAKGLMWQDNNFTEQLKRDEAVTYCGELTLGKYNDWRLPTDQELQTLCKQKEILSAYGDPSSDQNSAVYWYSNLETDPYSKRLVMPQIDFNGSCNPYITSQIHETSKFYTRCVRGLVIRNSTPEKNATNIKTNTAITIEFSETIDFSTIEVNSQDSECKGSVQLSGDDFNSCVPMTYDISSDQKTVTFRLVSELKTASNYQIEVSPEIKNSKGFGFIDNQSRLIPFSTRTWALDSDHDDYGFNKNPEADAHSPHVVEWKSKLYFSWKEEGEIRVAEWDGSNQKLIDGDGKAGINKSRELSFSSSQLIVFNNKLIASWIDKNSQSTGQVRVAEWDGDTTWSLMGRDEETGLNKNNNWSASSAPHLIVFNNKLYATWSEFGSNSIRVAAWNGAAWRFVDGNEHVGIKRGQTGYAMASQLIIFDNKLYVFWREQNSSGKYTIRAAEWDGNETWALIDGNGEDGIGTKPEIEFQPIVFNGKLYVAWNEWNSDLDQRIKLAHWDGGSNWELQNVYGENGVVETERFDHKQPRLTVFKEKLYMIYMSYERGYSHTYNPQTQLKVMQWDGTSQWRPADGSTESGIKKHKDSTVYSGQLVELNNTLHAIWTERKIDESYYFQLQLSNLAE